MKKKFRILRIDEPDFGCEGLPDDEILKDDVLIEDELGNRQTVKISDSLLYMLKLDEGDFCFIDESGNVSAE